jgi:sulfite exporter TauE/SafE
MCGPLVASYTLAASHDAQPSISSLAPHLLYNMGRITTYGFIGALMGLSGSFVNVTGRLAGIQNFVAVAAGVMMVLMGLGISGIWGNTAWIERHNSAVLRLAQRTRASRSPLRYYPLGLFLGLLPCGLSYTVFIASAGMGGPLPGMVTALLFGLGTLPALLLFGTIISSLSASLRGTIYRASGIVVIIMGIYFLFRELKTYAGL